MEKKMERLYRESILIHRLFCRCVGKRGRKTRMIFMRLNVHLTPDNLQRVQYRSAIGRENKCFIIHLVCFFRSAEKLRTGLKTRANFRRRAIRALCRRLYRPS